MAEQITRRDFIRVSAAAAAMPVAACVPRPFPVHSPNASAIPARDEGLLVNDVHSQLNATRVDAVVRPGTVDEVRAAVSRARSQGKSVSIAGGRHAMGGQQFGEANVLLDMRGLNRVLGFDTERGVIDVEGGIEWPQIIEHASRDTMLFPGDLIGSGSIGAGCIVDVGPENTGGWLKPGDVIELEIERMGVLRTPIIGRPDALRRKAESLGAATAVA